MEINRYTLEKLVCEHCGEYLSVGPVMLLEKGRSVCGRCSVPDPNEPLLRNSPYENLAKDILFPCRNAKHGCTEKGKFGVIKGHEAACEFRPYACFIQETATCEWFGPKGAILQHCRDKHPAHVVENPARFEHNISQALVKSYLMAVFNMLFLVHTKVCLTTKTIYHCVRLLADADNVNNYDFTLKILNGKNKVVKSGAVVSQGCMEIKDDDCLAIGINVLQAVFSNFAGTTFNLTINSRIEKSEFAFKSEPNVEPKQLLCCCKCNQSITDDLAYSTINERWLCSNCCDNKYMCKNKYRGCTYMDTLNKSKSHSFYYCNYRNICGSCSRVPIFLPFFREDQCDHSDITYTAGVTFIQNMSVFEKELIINSDVGKLHCQHRAGVKFYFDVCSPIPGGELHKYTCSIVIQNPDTEKTHHQILPLYNCISFLTTHTCDWQFLMKMGTFKEFISDGKFKIKLTITKTK